MNGTFILLKIYSFELILLIYGPFWKINVNVSADLFFHFSTVVTGIINLKMSEYKKVTLSTNYTSQRNASPVNPTQAYNSSYERQYSLCHSVKTQPPTFKVLTSNRPLPVSSKPEKEDRASLVIL